MSSVHKILSKPQRFIIRPASGWADLVLSETLEILLSSTQKYKFEPIAALEDGVVVVSDCDYRQGLELILRLTSAHDVEWVAHSRRISSRSEWPDFFVKSNVSEFFTKEEMSNLHVSALVTHPVVGTAKEVRTWAQNAWGIQWNDASEEESDEVSVKGLSHRIRIECTKNRARVLVSMAGAPLYRRGYKAIDGLAVAPLPEHHSSNCFRWSLDQFDPGLKSKILEGNVIITVPFAGTGTTGFESLCRIKKIAPGLSRRMFSCEKFSFHPTATMTNIKKRLRDQISNLNLSVVFGDVNGEVLNDLNIQVKSFSRSIGIDLSHEIIENDFLKNPSAILVPVNERNLKKPVVFLPLNPPYGLRLAQKTGSDALYERLALALVEFCRKFTAHGICGYVICPDEESWKLLNQRLRGFKLATRHFTHGGNDTRLLAFSSS